MQGPAVFMDISLEDQALELRKYFKSMGAEISEEKSPKGIEDDLHKIVGVCDACFKEPNEADIEAIFNSIVSIMVSIPLERGENLIVAFSQRLAKAPAPKLGMVALQTLWRLYNNLEANSPLRYHVYYHVVELGARVGAVRDIFTGVEQLRKEFLGCPPSNEQMQKLYRLLHQVLKDQNSELASKVMIELLGTYTDENASYAREDAIKCIVTALADPTTFLLDPLLSLKPVRFLEGELIHDLLTIFVSEKLSSYQAFYNNHKEFVHSQGLNHEQNIKKMRILSFMQMAESNPDITFDEITTELQIEEKDVEAFIIEVLKTRLVRARMDQAGRRVLVSSTMHRTFTPGQWRTLRSVLQAWRANVHAAHEQMNSVAAAQRDYQHQQTKAA
ncbi:eukaryotic translation initiation factor 3 subunit M [Pectinophora gossypiella]|uniref:eukaryotic translation initiation factor 3 subunit M n=1 Tax=Pectinophora gossypiella TaxID=13191 RepID=UPI00214F0C93|nr:eukaryotic translation initiation factor 3 subunit M [Pectinophora gossypiella]